MRRVYDKIIIGAGLYGLFAAQYAAKKGEHVLILECDGQAFQRATYANQARVHMGYHYPRSLTTAVKSAGYFKRFAEEFAFCIYSGFEQIYATSSQFSWTDAEQFMNFCRAAEIRCEEAPVSKYFKTGMCDGAFVTEEYTYDAMKLKEYYIRELEHKSNVELRFCCAIHKITRKETEYEVYTEAGESFASGYILNASYASSNQILKLVDHDQYEPFQIKYELCEIILCKPKAKLSNVGITVMDGPFFSIMPFGMTGYHSLTSVTFTPHMTSYDSFPSFSCQKGTQCSPQFLKNCNECEHKPKSAWPYMSRLANKYMKEEYGYDYVQSLFSMKPILKSSEVDDSRPTRIRIDSRKPYFVSVLSGKINTVYDLEDVL